MLATASRRSSASPPASADAIRAQAIAAVNTLRNDYGRWSRRCFRILDKHDRLVRFAMRDAQAEVGRAEREMLESTGMARLFLLKGRQGGFTTDQQGRSLHTIWSSPGVKCLTLAETREKSDAIFEITTRAIEHFPRELRPRLGAAETREISFPGLDSKFTTGTAGAIGIGRGLTLKRLHGSEFAFWAKPKKTLNQASPALERPGTTIVLETTASGYGSEAHEYWNETVAGKTGYRPLFFPWWRCDWEIYRTPLLENDELGKLEEDEQLLVTLHGLTLEHIKWRRSMIGKFGRSEFLQEYAEDSESCWLAPGGMFFDVETLKALMQDAPTPIETHLGGTLEEYSRPPQLGDVRGRGPSPDTVVIGADTAEGVAQDRSTFIARTQKSYQLVAAFGDNKITPKDFAAVLNTWGRKLGMALLVVEKNAHGITVLRHLRDDHEYPLDRIYHRRPLDGSTDDESERIGWATTAESKPLLLDAGRELLEAAKTGDVGRPPLSVVRDAFGVRRNDKGKVELNGKDMLVADMLAWIGRSTPDYVYF